MDEPLPEAETTGKSARLLGGCFSDLVGSAETRLKAATAEARARPFMVARVIVVVVVFGRECLVPKIQRSKNGDEESEAGAGTRW